MSGALNNVSFALQLHTKAMAYLQEQASTGARVNRPSDDPSAAYRILGLDSQKSSLVNYIDNLSDAISTLQLSSAIIEDMTSALIDAKVHITQISNGIYDEESRNRTADAINDILERMVSLANTKQVDQYIFAGSDTDTQPYVVQRTSGEITSITYQGSSQTRDIEVAPGVQSSAFYSGDNIFRSDSRTAPVFLGNTGAAAGTGTSSVRGDVWLTITDESPTEYRLSINDGTDYETVLKGKGSEEQTLAFSAVPTSGSFTLTFDGQKTTAIQWNEGAAEVETALEELSNLDEGDVTVSGTYAAGFTITFADTLGNVPELVAGDNTLDNSGPITITEDTTTEGIGDTNLAVTNSAGRVLYVNTTGIINTGVDLVRVEGTYDIFNTLISIRDILKNERAFSDTRVIQLINNSIESVEEIRNLLIEKQVSIGSKTAFLDNLKGTLENVKFNTENETTTLEEADIAQIAIDLSRREVLYQMSLAVAARVMSISLLDFIR